MARPNFLLIMTDQQRWDAIGAHGNPHIQTPNLDRLIDGGVTFRRAYAEAPECVPSRATLLTGKWSHNNGAYSNATPLRDGEWTFARALGEAGYECAGFGKMHFRPVRARHGFERLELSEEVPPSPELDDFLTDLQATAFAHVDEPHGIRHHMYYLPQGSQLPDELHTTTWTAQRTIDFLESRAGGDRPFFAFTSFINPHPPFEPTIPFASRHDPAMMPPPVRGERDREAAWSLLRAQTYTKWMENTGEPLSQAIKAAYYGSISQIDFQIGRMLDALERTGQRDNTLVVFVSDHGELLGDHYQWGKRSFYDSAARIPFVLNWPGTLAGGGVRDELVGLRDLAPAFLALAGADGDGSLDGEDLLPVASGEAVAWRNITFGELFDDDRATFMACDGRWKYAYAVNGGREMLFDLESDPDELVNLAGDAAAERERVRLRRELVEFFAREGLTRRLAGGDLLATPERDIHPNEVRGGIDAQGRDRAYSKFRKAPLAGSIERNPLSGGQTRAGTA